MFNVKSLWRLARALYKPGAQFSNYSVLQDYAIRAYNHCCDWFGEPTDPEFRFELIRWHRSLCYRDRGNRRYLLFISDSNSIEATCRRIGHEMFHRVRWEQAGLGKQTWVNEMLACAVSDRIMEAEGMENYVYAARQTCFSSDRLDVARLPTIHRKTGIAGFTSESAGYPNNFGCDMIRLGQALVILCGWSSFIRMGSALTLDEWMSSIPYEYRNAVRVILNNEQVQMDPTVVNPEAQFHYYQAYGRALYWIGDAGSAIEALQIALDHRPKDADTHLYLANALWQANRRQEAMSILSKALEIDHSSMRMHYTLAEYATNEGDFTRAAAAYRALTHLNPDDNVACYYLGVTLYEQGAFREAERVLNAIPIVANELENQAVQEVLVKVRQALGMSA